MSRKNRRKKSAATVQAFSNNTGPSPFTQAAASEPNRGAAYRMKGDRDWHVCTMSELAQVCKFPGVEWMELVNANPGRIFRAECSGCGCRETMDDINSRNPEALSCCPERRITAVLVPIENDTPLADLVDTHAQMKAMLEAFEQMPESARGNLVDALNEIGVRAK